MKKYLVFIKDHYYPGGGASDLFSHDENLDELLNKLYEKVKSESHIAIEIWDTDASKMKDVNVYDKVGYEETGSSFDIKYIKNDFFNVIEETEWEDIKTTEERFG